MDLFDTAGLKKPDISILSGEFLAEVKHLPQRNLAVELLFPDDPHPARFFPHPAFGHLLPSDGRRTRKPFWNRPNCFAWIGRKAFDEGNFLSGRLETDAIALHGDERYQPCGSRHLEK